VLSVSSRDTDNTDRRDKTISHADDPAWGSDSGSDSGSASDLRLDSVMQSAPVQEPECRLVSGLDAGLEPPSDSVRDSASGSELDFRGLVEPVELPAALPAELLPDSASRPQYPLPRASAVVNGEFSRRCASGRTNMALQNPART
jgi:hypothetical protein